MTRVCGGKKWRKITSVDGKHLFEAGRVGERPRALKVLPQSIDKVIDGIKTPGPPEYEGVCPTPLASKPATDCQPACGKQRKSGTRGLGSCEPAARQTTPHGYRAPPSIRQAAEENSPRTFLFGIGPVNFGDFARHSVSSPRGERGSRLGEKRTAAYRATATAVGEAVLSEVVFSVKAR
ncbi:hypothetical protein K0M31_014022 [Melipona bicolor]|uniref:Uncharacterized protein n=1 Tax=Melipona bicolor TaxID=60889 RepID=A0AA40G7P8_9HYME|nr:hypothetical protein K0M31_014022 [Melipona bicolor]